MATQRFDFSGVMARLSTVLSMISSGCTAAALYFIAAPPEWRGGFPAVYGFALMGLGLAANLLTPFATSFKQKRFMPDDTDQAGA